MAESVLIATTSPEAGQWVAVSDSAWLGISPSGGPAGAITTANITIDPGGLASGTYNGFITVSSGCAAVSQFKVLVTFTYIKGGTITVKTNTVDAAFKIKGPETYSGTGVFFEADGVPEGDYTITYEKVPGFKTPPAQTLAVVFNKVEFDGVYVDLRRRMEIVATRFFVGGGLREPSEASVFDPAGGHVFSFYPFTLADGFYIGRDAPKGRVHSGANSRVVYPSLKTPLVSKFGVTTATATGDVDGDGLDDILAAVDSTVQGRGIVKGFYADGTEIPGLSFAAFNKGHGVSIAAGDLDGDGVEEIITAAAPEAGNLAHVRVFSFLNGTVSDTGINFLAHSGHGGTHIAAGDLDGDGIAEIITAPGLPLRCEVRTWRADTSGGAGNWRAVGLSTYPAPQGCSSIAAGDLDADARDEIIIAVFSSSANGFGLGQGFSSRGGRNAAFPHTVHKARIIGIKADGTLAVDFYPGSDTAVHIAVGDTDFDGAAEIVVGQGVARDSGWVRVFKADGTLIPGREFQVPGEASGIRVSIGEFGRF